MSLRIAFALYGDLNSVSGGFIYDRMLVEHLRVLGAEVDVVPMPWPSYAGGLLRNIASPAFARPLTHYDVLIQDELAHPSFALQNLSLRRRTRVVGLLHNLTSVQPSTVQKPLKRVVEAQYLRSLDGLIAVCRSSLDDARAAGARCPSIVAYAGVDHVNAGIAYGAIDARASEPGALRVLFLAQVLRHKGLHRLVRAVAALSREVQLEVHVVGSTAADPPYIREVEDDIARHHVDARFVFHGELRGAALIGVLERAHVLALPSDREAYPLSCLEAQAFGLPVLVTDQGGTRELVDHGRDGYLLAPDDIRAWSACLEHLSRSRVALAELGCAARVRHEARPTWRDTAGQVLAFLRSVAER
jgi:glycosyltransferase involved in cell wall biosynthesis